jgi:hypothetical protein
VRHVEKGKLAGFAVAYNYLSWNCLYSYCQPERFTGTSISGAGTESIAGNDTEQPTGRADYYSNYAASKPAASGATKTDIDGMQYL